MKNLENYGVHEMNAKDMEEVNGGGPVIAAVAVAAAVYFTYRFFKSLFKRIREK